MTEETFKKEEIPHSVYNNWQRIVNIMAEMLDTTAALISKVEKPYIQNIRLDYLGLRWNILIQNIPPSVVLNVDK
jgi:hypothetical protein